MDINLILLLILSMAAPPFCLDTSPLNDEMQQLAEKELRETPKIREAAIIELRRLLHENTDLHFRDDDDFLLIFLRPCHFYPESAIKMVSTFIGQLVDSSMASFV